MESTQSTTRAEPHLVSPSPRLWLKDALSASENLSCTPGPVTLRANLNPAQIKALVVPVSLGGPSWGTSFSVWFSGMLQKSVKPPRCSLLWSPQPQEL